MFQAMSKRVALVSLLWSDENLLEVARSINIWSLRDEDAALRKRCQENKKSSVCYTKELKIVGEKMAK